MLKEYISYLKDNPNHYWFKARLYGWGWVPVTWQGWVVMLVFILLLIGNAYRFDARLRQSDSVPIEFIIETVVLVAVLLTLCWKTGERPRWQWGIPKK